MVAQIRALWGFDVCPELQDIEQLAMGRTVPRELKRLSEPSSSCWRSARNSKLLQLSNADCQAPAFGKNITIFVIRTRAIGADEMLW
jgi:hypothetical protein